MIRESSRKQFSMENSTRRTHTHTQRTWTSNDDSISNLHIRFRMRKTEKIKHPLHQAKLISLGNPISEMHVGCQLLLLLLFLLLSRRRPFSPVTSDQKIGCSHPDFVKIFSHLNIRHTTHGTCNLSLFAALFRCSIQCILCSMLSPLSSIFRIQRKYTQASSTCYCCCCRYGCLSCVHVQFSTRHERKCETVVTNGNMMSM